MANLHRGEVPLNVGDKTYTLRLGINALCDIESVLGVESATVAIQELMGNVLNARPPMRVLRAVLWAGMSEHHPNVTLKNAGEIIEAISLQETVTAVGALIHASFPKREAGGEGTENPK